MYFKKFFGLVVFIGMMAISYCSFAQNSDEEHYFIHPIKPYYVKVNANDRWKDDNFSQVINAFSSWRVVDKKAVELLIEKRDKSFRSCDVVPVFDPNGVKLSCHMRTPQMVNGDELISYEYATLINYIDRVPNVADNPNIYFAKYKSE